MSGYFRRHQTKSWSLRQKEGSWWTGCYDKFCKLWQQNLKDFGGFIGDQIKNGYVFAADSTIGIQSNKEENGQCQKDLWKFLSLCQKIVNSFVWNWLMEDWGILTLWWF